MAEVTASVNLDMQGFRDQIRRADERWNSFASGMKKGALIIGGALAFKKVFDASSKAMSDFVKGGFQLNSQLQTATATFEVFTKSAEKANSIVEALRRRSDVSPFDTAETIEAGKALISTAKGSEAELMKLIKTAEVLAALNPAQGLAGAAFSLKEAVSGDYVSIIERFNLSRSMINQLKGESKSGLDLVNTALQSIGAGPELVEKLGQTFEGQKNKASSFFTELQQKATAPMFDYLSNALSDFVGYMDGDGKDRMAEAGEAMAATLKNTAETVVSEIKKINFNDLAESLETVMSAIEKTASVGKWAAGIAKDGWSSVKAVGEMFAGDYKSEDLIKKYFPDRINDEQAAAQAREGAVYDKGEDRINVRNNWMRAHGYKIADLEDKNSAAYQAVMNSPFADTAVQVQGAKRDSRRNEHQYAEVVDATLQKHGIDRKDLYGKSGQEARRDLIQKFGYDQAKKMIRDDYNSLPGEIEESIQADYRKARRQANNAARAQAVKVNINMITRSPTHDIMSI